MNVIVGNHFKAAGLGIFNQTFSYFMLLSIIANLGVPNSLVKYTAEYSDNKDKLSAILSGSIILNFTISFILTIIIYFIIVLFGNLILNPELKKSLLIAIISIPIYALNKNYLGFLNGSRRMNEYSIFQTFRWLILISFIVMAIIMNQSIYFTMYCLIFTESILFIVLTIKLKNYISFSKHNPFYIKHFKFGIKTIMAFVVDEISKSASILMIGYFLGNQQAGVFSFASTIALGILMLPSVVQTNFNPIISNLFAKNDIHVLQSYMKKIQNIMFKIMLPSIGLVLILFPIGTKIFMHGHEYDNSFLPFYLLMIGASTFSLFAWAGGMLSMAGLLKENFIRVVISLGCNVILNIILIPIFGIAGAAMALTTNYLLQLFVLRYYLKTKMNLILF